MKDIKTEVVPYGYYSKLLNKPFDTLEELKSAEDEYNKAHAAELQKTEERRTKAKAIEEAYRNVMQVRREASQKIREAEAEYYKLRDEFIREYGSYHISYTNTDGEENLSVSSILDAFFNPKF